MKSSKTSTGNDATNNSFEKVHPQEVVNNNNSDNDNDESSSIVSDSSKKSSRVKKPAASASETLQFVFQCGCATRAYLLGGVLGGVAHGLAWPMVAYFLAQSYQTMNTVSDLPQEEQAMSQIRQIAYTFMILGVYVLVSAFVHTFCMELTSVHASKQLQLQWFRALLRQDAAYFDVSRDVAGMAALVGPSTILYQKGVGRKLGEGVQHFTTGIGGMILGLYSSWKVTLLILAVLPLMSMATWFAIQMNQTKSARAAECYRQAGSVAYTTVSNMKTVLSLNAVPEMIQQYQQATQSAFSSAVAVLWQLGFWNGSLMGSFMVLLTVVVLFGSFVMYRAVRDTGCDPAGGILGAQEECGDTGAEIFGALLGITFAGQSISQVGNCVDAFTEARVAVAQALRVINRTPGAPPQTIYKTDEETTDDKSTSSNKKGDANDNDDDLVQAEQGSTYTMTPTATIQAVLPKYEINPFSQEGRKLQKVQGRIEFRNVTFCYPTRPSQQILKHFSMVIPAGKTVAIVGPSGGGKSTVMALMERFYDPLEGSVSLDGVDIKDLNVAHYRSLLSYVGQEPALFATTIRENIAYGFKEGQEISQEQIEAAVKQANADFITSLPNGYDTQVGDHGSQISGGQKQRIAIARALVSQPKVLFLDEATSALDSESELVVQDALDKIVEQHALTTVIIAHRLSTIRNADIIHVVMGGAVVESGTHEELMDSAAAGYYRQLVEKQEEPSSSQPKQETPLVQQESSLTLVGEDYQSSQFLAPSSEFLEPTSEFLALSSKPFTHESTALDGPYRPLVPYGNTPHLEFRGVGFAYPARPGKKIFQNFNLSIMPGETIALVGPSGGGKSTTVALVERFYDPLQGSVEYLGHDIKSLNVRWYRDQIGYVGQEPKLFADSIAKNISYGAPHVTPEAIQTALEQSNAATFVKAFPEGINTFVGENTQLSGGQKQRIAIARALVRKPKVLILDEATSALDSESEALVQKALSTLMASRQHTTLVIAHKLSTVRRADRIAFVAGGEVLEIGSHEELMSKKRGHYKRLVHAQRRGSTLANIAHLKSIESVLREDDPSDGPAVNKLKKGNSEIVGEEEMTVDPGLTIKRVKQLASPDVGFILVGSVGAVMSGASYPLMGILFAESVGLFYYIVRDCQDELDATSLGFDTCSDYWNYAADDMQKRSFYIALYFTLVVIDTILGGMFLYWGFGQASERLSKRVRDSTFVALVRQEIGYFDKHSIGDITSELQNSTARLQAFTGAPVRSFLEASAGLLTGIIIAFVSMWPYALLSLACIPPMGFAARLRRKSFAGTDDGNNESEKMKSSGGILVESLLNIKTVAALSIEERRFRDFEEAVMESQRDVLCDALISGLTAGIGDFIQRWVNALMYFWGGYLLIHYPSSFDFSAFLTAQFAFLFSTFSLGAAFQDIDDRKEVEESATRLFSLLDRQSKIDPLSDEGKILDTEGRMLEKEGDGMSDEVNALVIDDLSVGDSVSV